VGLHRGDAQAPERSTHAAGNRARRGPRARVRIARTPALPPAATRARAHAPYVARRPRADGGRTRRALAVRSPNGRSSRRSVARARSARRRARRRRGLLVRGRERNELLGSWSARAIRALERAA